MLCVWGDSPFSSLCPPLIRLDFFFFCSAGEAVGGVTGHYEQSNRIHKAETTQEALPSFPSAGGLSLLCGLQKGTGVLGRVCV